MRVLFASGELFPPALYGGAECSVDELARELVGRGHPCEVVARLGHGAARLRHRVRRLVGRASGPATCDRGNGYPTWRAPLRDVDGAFAARLRAFRPDVVLTWNEGAGRLAAAAGRAGVRAIVWVPDLTMRGATEGLDAPDGVAFAASSAFLAARVAARLGRPVAALRPLIRLDAYRCAARRPAYVTFVNPRGPKGVEVALEVAADLPSRRFLFVVSHPLPPAERAALDARRRRLRNVTLRGPFRDMRDVYARTAVLLVPSQCEDASPRVIVEAHVNGIPVVASDVGGVAEVSGGATVLLPRDAPTARWVAEVERLLTDPAAHEDVARRSRANAASAAVGPDAVVAAFLRIAGGAPPPSARPAAEARVGVRP